MRLSTSVTLLLHHSLQVLLLLSFIVCSLGNLLPAPEASLLEEKDAQAGDTIKLTCRYDPSIKGSDKEFISYWQKTNGKTPDVIAVNDKALSNEYSLDVSDGKYDLTILSAHYDRDNGHFECKIKETGSGDVIQAKKYAVTILIAPGPPIITPSKDIAKEGEAFRLTCSSEGGSPDPIIQWYKNNVPIQGDLRPGRSRENATSNVLEIKPTILDDRSHYQCTVWNRAIRKDDTKNASYTLTVHYVPRVRVGPFNPLNVLKGSDALMTCSVDANPPATRIRWYKNDRIISLESNHTVVNVVPADSGVFVCVAENGVYDVNGNSGRGELEFSVQYAPIVSLAPEKEVVASESVSVTCNVKSNPLVNSIVWSKEGDKSFRMTGDTLHMDSVSPNDTGVYTCTASNLIKPSGSLNGFEQSANASVSLKVRHAPGNSEIVPANPVAISGRAFSLTCNSSPPGWPRVEYRWWKEGAEKKELSSEQHLNFTAIHVKHEGRYYCQASNSLGKGASGSVYLTVNEAPSVTIPMPPNLVRKVSDKSFSLVCRGRSKPKSTVTWYHNGRPVTGETGRYRVDTRESLEDANVYFVQSQLHLESLSKKTNAIAAMDSGRYSCVFDNGIGSSAKAESILRVEHSPVVRHTYNKVAFDVGENATLQCKMSAFPEPSFEWSFHSKPIEPSRRYYLNRTAGEDDIFIGNLVINSVRNEDYGHYLCRSWNTVGDDDEKTNIQLVKKSAPDAPSAVEATEVLSDSATLRWKEGFNGGYSNTEFIITYSLEGGKWKNESCRTMNPCRITSLESRSEYVLKVLAINAGGQSPYSEEITVTTKVNLKDMPSAYEAYYDSLTSTLSFRIEETTLPLVAKIEIRESGNADWLPLTVVPIISDAEEMQLKQSSAIADMRIMLCLQSNDSWCGYECLVKMDSLPGFVKETKGLSLDQFVMYLLFTCLLIIGSFVIFFCCCCLRRKNSSDIEKAKNVEREDEAAAKARSLTLNQPYYPSHESNKVLVNGDPLHHDHASKLSSLPIYATANASGHLPQKYYLTGDMNDPSPSGSQETAQSDLWMMKQETNEPLEVPISYQSLFNSNNAVDPNYPYYYTHEEYPDDAINLKNSLYTSYYDESQVVYGTTTHVPQLMQDADAHKLDEDEYGSGRNGRVIREIIV